jgi:branched-chain amino acid transport system permease protein
MRRRPRFERPIVSASTDTTAATPPPAADTERERRRYTATDALKWAAIALGVVLLLRVLLTEDMRLHFITGASLTQGALVAAIALGVVLTYRGSGVVNFATGAIAMYAAYVYTDLRMNGELFIPPLPNPLVLIEAIAHHLDKKSTLTVPHWPTGYHFAGPLDLKSSLIIALIFGVVFGLALHFLIFRPLRHAPPLAKVVASVGVLLLLQAVVVRRFGSGAQATLLRTKPAGRVTWLPFSITMNTEQLTVIIIVVLFTVLLWALFRFTRFGLATRAAAENEKGAMLLGFSPEFLAGTNWVLSTVISALLGILVAGNQHSVDPLTITLLVIPALSVALVGNLTSFGITTAAAFGLAMTQALIGYFSLHNWWPKAAGAPLPGVADLLPFLVIVAVLYFRGNALPTRGSISSGHLPFAPNPSKVSTRIVAPITIAACAIVLMVVATPNGRLAIMTSLIGVVISLSFVVITGYIGQISLAQMMLAGISGFTLSKLTQDGIHLYGHTIIPSLPLPLNALVSAFVAMLVGLLVALPALRVRGVHLAIVTFAFAVAMDSFLFQNPGVNGGFRGAPVTIVRNLDPVQTAVIGRGNGANVWFGIFCLAVVTVLGAMIVNLRRSATGRRLLATRSNERAAAAAGIDVAATKRTAFSIAAFIAGLGGALVAFQIGKADALYFGDIQSLTVFAFAYLGGIACISGAVTAGLLVPGGVIFVTLQTVFKIPPDFTLILGSLAVIVTAILNPEGIAGGVGARLRQRARRSASAPDRTAKAPAPAVAAESGAAS